jgi:hypothetical protein
MPPEGYDEAVAAFSNEVAPRSAPRDQRGKPVAESGPPEPMFSPRPLEGDPLTGDTRDGGDNPRLRALERDVADGRVREREDGESSPRSRRAPAEDERSGRQRRSPDAAERNDATADEGYAGAEDEPEDIWAIAAEGDDLPRADERTPAEGDERVPDRSSERDSEAERFEVSADGETFHVTLEEALRGYSREQTFHKRLAHLNQVSQELQQNQGYLQASWAQWQKARQDYEEDVARMLPTEPNWDQEFAVNPHNAHAQQKVFQTIYAKLAASRQARAEREAAAQQEHDRQVQDYAVKGFSKFVMDNKIPDEPTLKKNLHSMRKTAANAGFSEYEVATVYDPRMLTVLLKASRYDRMMAARPRAVIPGKGRTLTPGAATPLNGNGQRRGLDEALRRQASSGSLDATAEVFRRLL